jgi:hypothetical protein
MFNFINKKSKRVIAEAQNKKPVVAENSSSTEYIKSIEDRVISAWMDPVLENKFGLKNLFSVGARVSPTLSYDDACECLNRLNKLIEMSTYVLNKFPALLESAVDDEKDRICSANTIETLFLEAKQEVKLSDNKAENTQIAIETINDLIDFLPSIKNSTLKLIVYSAHAELKQMRGFED